MAQQFDGRSRRRISNGIRRIERGNPTGNGSRGVGFGYMVQGILKTSTGDPGFLGNTTAASTLQVWAYHKESGDFERLMKDGEPVEISVINIVPNEYFSQGSFVTCFLIGGFWQILSGSCPDNRFELDGTPLEED